MFIRNKVKEIISEFGTNNPFEIIDILDITLVFYPLHDSIKGFLHIKDDKYPVIYINSNLCQEERTMTAAHELGHYFCHSGINFFACRGMGGSYIKDKSERQAYIFAAELLISDNVFDEYPGESDSYIASKIEIKKKLLALKFREKLR